jgi:hypothetical protein
MCWPVRRWQSEILGRQGLRRARLAANIEAARHQTLVNRAGPLPGSARYRKACGTEPWHPFATRLAPFDYFNIEIGCDERNFTAAWISIGQVGIVLRRSTTTLHVIERLRNEVRSIVTRISKYPFHRTR